MITAITTGNNKKTRSAMKASTLLATIFILFAFAIPNTATAKEASNSKTTAAEMAEDRPRKKNKKKYRPAKKRRVIKKQRHSRRHARGYAQGRRRYVPHRRTRVVVRAAPVRHVAVYSEERVTTRHYRRPPQQSEDKMLGIGIRLIGATTEGEYLNLATVENPTMGGFGLQLRGKVSPRIGIEFGLDYMVGDGGEMIQTTIPVMLSMMYNFFPRSAIRPYALVGAGIHLTKLEYDSGFRYDTIQFAGQLGGGLEFRLTQSFGISTDLRVLGLFKNLGSQTSVERECLSSSAGNTGFCTSGGRINTDDQFSMGAQFMVGANLYF
jgi:Outer membrane protein beta-barrel domain